MDPGGYANDGTKLKSDKCDYFVLGDETVPAEIPVFEEEILNVAKTDKVPPLFEYFGGNLAELSENVCFVKTTFHNSFLKKIVTARNNVYDGKIQTMVGIQGIGKTSSTLYYVLRCRKNGDEKVHYVDLKYLEQNDRDMKIFPTYAKSIKLNDCLIIDHVTLFNSCLIEEINRFLPVCKKILIETGFTVCKSDKGNDRQLDKAEFVQIWNGTLLLRSGEWRRDSLKDIGNEVYSEFENIFIITPRLLHHTMGNMLLESNINLETLYWTTIMWKKREIEDFRKKLEKYREKKEYEPFILHTRLLLDCLLDKSEVICTDAQASDLNIAINIFKVEECIAEEKDFLDHNFLDLEISQGMEYKKISLLEPSFGKIWRQNFQLEHGSNIVSLITVRSILEFYLENGDVRKKLEERLVNFQKNSSSVIIPEVAVLVESECSEMLTSTRSEYKQIETVKLVLLQDLTILRPDMNSLKAIEIGEKYEGHINNIYRTAYLLKAYIDKNVKPLLLFPKVKNLMGFDYFVYLPVSPGTSDDPGPAKKTKVQHNLYLVQVATGATHGGNAMAKAMPVFKEVLTDVIVHVIVMIFRKNTAEHYTLRGNYQFTNVSFINLACAHILSHVDSELKSLIGVLRNLPE